MKQNLHFVTIATRDLAATRAFYGALGWTPLADVEDEIIFFQAAPSMVLGFFEAEKFNEDMGSTSDRSEVSGITLSHNVESPDEVRAVVDAMAAAGGTVLKEPQPGKFGGVFNAHVQDPNGVVWEIAHNPGWQIDARGNVSLG